MEITDFLDLKMLYSVHQILTCYADNINNSNLIVDLIFLWPDLVVVDNYLCYDLKLELRLYLGKDLRRS